MIFNNLKGFVNQYINDYHFKAPTKVQEAVIPTILKKNSMIVTSHTGTGKTHAFLLPIFNLIDENNKQVQAVITAPTRELAMQIYQHANKITKFNENIKVSLFIGGEDKQKSMDKLSVQPQIVIGTPGRLKDLFDNEKVLLLNTADILVVDEADMTLEFGFLEDVDVIAGKMKENLQMLVFSATIPQSLEPFLKKYLVNPKIVRIDADKATNTNIKHYLVPTRHKNRYNVLKQLMKGFNPFVCIIFCNTRKNVADLALKLRDDGFKVGEIHGDLEPRLRKQMIKRINNHEYSFIVATDIAARGIDIDGVSHIINYDLPSELDFYIHRTGRSGRLKYEGMAYSLYDSEDITTIRQLENKGISFLVLEYKNDTWNDLGEFDAREKRVFTDTETSKEVSRIINVSKKQKVKPGYKKKRKNEIGKVVRKERRMMIKADIKKQQKERAKKSMYDLSE